MNILEQEDIIKGLPDQALMKEASAPSGQVPQFLVISEIKRRSDMRKRYEQEQQPQGTVKDQIVMEAMGIAPMMPAGMTPPAQPMGPAGAPPMGGMPPQGVPPMAPPMPQGMPPMPQGGIASAPPAMPPMGMAQGGIVQMANGGSTSMPGAGALYGMQKEYVDPLLDRAKVLAQTAGISIEEAYEALVRQAQMNMPDYSMIAPAGMGEMPSLGGVDRAVGDAIGSAYAQIPQFSSRDYLGEVGSAADALADRLPDMPQPPTGTRPPKAIAGGIDLAAGIGAGMDSAGSYIAGKGDALLEGISTLGGFIPDNPARSVKDFILGPFADNREMIAAADRARPMVEDMGQARADEQARLLADLQMDAIDDAQVQGKTDATVQSTGQTKPQVNQNITPTTDGTEPSVVASAVDLVAKAQDRVGRTPQRSSDSEGGIYGGAISSIDQMIADLSGRETQASPVLDLSDVIERSRKGTLAETFMRLGAGVAGGDISKGIAGAADAASKGRQELSRLEMAERIAKTKAGQEDIRRGEQRDLDMARLGLQRGQLALMDQRLSNELGKAERVSKGQLFSLVSDLVKEATDDMMTEDRLEAVDRLSAYFMQKYAPLLDIALTEEDLKRLGETYSGAKGGATVDPAQFET